MWNLKSKSVPTVFHYKYEKILLFNHFLPRHSYSYSEISLSCLTSGGKGLYGINVSWTKVKKKLRWVLVVSGWQGSGSIKEALWTICSSSVCAGPDKLVVWWRMGNQADPVWWETQARHIPLVNATISCNPESTSRRLPTNTNALTVGLEAAPSNTGLWLQRLAAATPQALFPLILFTLYFSSQHEWDRLV